MPQLASRSTLQNRSIAMGLALALIASQSSASAVEPDVAPPPPMVEDTLPDAATVSATYRCGDASVTFEINTSLKSGVSISSYAWSGQVATPRDLAIINRYLAQMKYASAWTVRCVGAANRLIVDGYDHRPGWIDNRMSVQVYMGRASVVNVKVYPFHSL